MFLLLYPVPLVAVVCLLGVSWDNLNRLRKIALSGSLLVLFEALFLGSFLKLGFFYWVFELGYVHILFTYDGISHLFVLLTALLVVICVLISWNTIDYLVKEFLLCLLVLEFLLIVLFTTGDILVFYAFFEALLVPMILIIGVWGARKEKVRATYYFFFYTFAGSLCMLISILSLVGYAGSTDYFVLCAVDFPFELEIFCFLGFFLGLGIKIPLFPFHIWLPQAHVEAPTVGSVLLAGILLKVGGYGLLRFTWPLFPVGSEYFAPFIMVLCCLSMVYAGLTACRQTDLKRLIAYSSVSHMGLATASLFSQTYTGMVSAAYLMFSHGLTSAALFILVGFLYSRYGTRLISNFRGLSATMPLFSCFFFLALVANCSLPATANFIGEFLAVYSVVGYSHSMGIITLFGGGFLSVVYSILLFNRVCFGSPSRITCKERDLTRLQFLIILPLALLTFFLGIFPWHILDLLGW